MSLLRKHCFAIGTFVALALGLFLRLKGIHNPILDHPNWRQGDMASVARNFATLKYNILYPQTNYNGPPPNYVELELQIVPFLAATLYKVFGVHEIFGRLITIAFSLATVGVLGLFGRWLFSSAAAGITAALLYAVMPGAVYYGRTFTPDATMVFFLTAALYICARMIVEDELWKPRALARSAALVTLAYLAKPVAVAGIIPLAAMIWERAKEGRTMRVTAVGVLLLIPVFILALYQHAVGEHAEWHWSSGIMQLHVFPSLLASLTSLSAFGAKLGTFWHVLGMLRKTMLGTMVAILALFGIAAIPVTSARTKALLWGWLAAGLLYTYVVVTVEQVDYYMFPLLPLAALLIAGSVSWLLQKFPPQGNVLGPWPRVAALVILTFFIAQEGRAAVAPYYKYNKQAYRNAIALSRTLPNAPIVMGHYGPDVLYYMNRYGWEEDPYLWTPFDEESAIKKGARAFVSIEDNRLRKNVELCNWLQRFPVVNASAEWPVYETDPTKILPGAEQRWQKFRAIEKAGKATPCTRGSG